MQKKVFQCYVAQSTLFSPRRSAEMKWSRTVNSHGHAVYNVPVDLHMEHLNRRLNGFGSNITPESVQRAYQSPIASKDKNLESLMRVINYGIPNTLEELVHETGRAGRNEIQDDTILYAKVKL